MLTARVYVASADRFFQIKVYKKLFTINHVTKLARKGAMLSVEQEITKQINHDNIKNLAVEKVFTK